MTRYIHPLMQHPENRDAVREKQVKDAVLANRVAAQTGRVLAALLAQPRTFGE